jgi:uncharacterized membrane protein YgcG
MLRDLLGDQRAQELSEELGYAIDQMKTFGWKEFRPWSEFFAVLKLPQWNAKHLQQRVTTNFIHYRSNYAAICMGIFAIRLLFAPYLFLAIVVVVSLSVYLLVLQKTPIVVGDMTLNTRGKQILCAVFSLVFLALSGALELLLWTIIYCVVICLLHMVFRPRSVTSKTNKLYDELKLTGFTWFGGQGHGSQDPSSSVAGVGIGADFDPESAAGGGSGSSGSGSGSGSGSEDSSFQAGMTSASVRKRPGGGFGGRD